jgi:hypothetical protein
MSVSKVFGIGLSRTGTTSLHEALKVLGFKSIHYPPAPNLHQLLKYFDAASDTPIAAKYKELDSCYPNSKFILTVREREAWLRSTERLFSGSIPNEEWRRDELRQLYGTLRWNKEMFTAAYSKHLADVLEYFHNRPLLIIDIASGAGWGPLCKFLNKPVPETSFPHVTFNLPATKSLPKNYWQDKT